MFSGDFGNRAAEVWVTDALFALIHLTRKVENKFLNLREWAEVVEKNKMVHLLPLLSCVNQKIGTKWVNCNCSIYAPCT